MRHVWLAALAGLTVACGAYSFPGEHPSPAGGSGTVTGRVVAVPCAPIERAGDTCAGRPVPNLEIDYTGTDGGVSRTVTDASGNYAIRLATGDYAVKLKAYMRVISGPLKLDVASGSNTVANYVLDSGIRVPLPMSPAAQK